MDPAFLGVLNALVGSIGLSLIYLNGLAIRTDACKRGDKASDPFCCSVFFKSSTRSK
jgi:hypothetical protein